MSTRGVSSTGRFPVSLCSDADRRESPIADTSSNPCIAALTIVGVHARLGGGRKTGGFGKLKWSLENG
jgi:hypothetical protein